MIASSSSRTLPNFRSRSRTLCRRMPDRYVQGQHLFRRPFEVRSPLADRTASFSAKCAESRRERCSIPSTLAMRVRWRRSMPTPRRKPFTVSPISSCAATRRRTFSDTEAEIGEAVDFVVHVERQPGRRVVREVLALRGYDRDAKRFLIEPVFEVQHATASARNATPMPPTSSPVLRRTIA